MPRKRAPINRRCASTVRSSSPRASFALPRSRRPPTAYWSSSPALTSFRELGLGFNPKLVVPSGSPYLPYYGYGDAVVRMSLGDNTELAGAVRGGASRWLFFPNTTLTVGTERIVVDGHLAPAYR